MKIITSLIYFIISTRIKYFFKSNISYLIVFWRLTLLLNILFSAFIVSLILNASLENKINFKPNQIIVIVNVTIFLIIIFRKFFPIYKFTTSLFNPYHPLSFAKKAIIDGINNLLSPVFLNSFLFCLLLLGSNVYSFIDFSCSIIIIFIGFFAENSLKLFVEKEQYKKLYFILSYLVAGILFFITNFLFSLYVIYNGLYILFLLFCFLLEYLLWIYLIKRSKTNNSIISIKQKFNYSILDYFRQSLWQRKNARTVLITGFVIKIIVLILNFFSYYSNKQFLFNNEILFWLFITPLILFSYIFNNLLGFLREHFFIIQKSSYKLKNFKKIYLVSLSNSLLLDFVISFIALMSVDKLDTNSLIYYISLTVFFVVTGFMGSLILPILVIKPFTTNSILSKANTSPIISIPTFILTFIFVLIIEKSYFPLVGMGLIFISVFIFFNITSARKFSYRIYNKLFNNE